MKRDMPFLDLIEFVGSGIIIPCSSGVVVSNQCGGISCRHPEVEGVFVPYGNDYNPPNQIYSLQERLGLLFDGPDSKYQGSGASHGPDPGLDDNDADYIDGVLDDWRQGLIRVDRTRLGESLEAWVWVTLMNEDEHSVFLGFGPYPRPGILTWFNSD